MPIPSPRTILLIAGSLAGSLAATAPCLAHAFLDHAVPSVGGTVVGAPAELDLAFTQDVVVALCRVDISRAGGGTLPAAPPTGNGGASSPVLRVRIARPLPPGRYVVTWHVVAVDTHPTSGSYKFTVAP